MNVLTLLGSPRRRGNTATVLSLFESRLPPGVCVERINVVDHKIRGCVGCGNCQGVLDQPGCRQRDEAQYVFQRMFAADVLIYATPLYAWSFTAQMKALLDRHYCLTKWRAGEVAVSLLEGRRAALLVTCGDAIEDNADVIQVEFDRMMAAAHCAVIGRYIVPHCSEPENLGEDAARVAEALADQVCALA
jgi:multimeric flavodoxin WrbA